MLQDEEAKTEVGGRADLYTEHFKRFPLSKDGKNQQKKVTSL